MSSIKRKNWIEFWEDRGKIISLMALSPLRVSSCTHQKNRPFHFPWSASTRALISTCPAERRLRLSGRVQFVESAMPPLALFDRGKQASLLVADSWTTKKAKQRWFVNYRALLESNWTWREWWQRSKGLFGLSGNDWLSTGLNLKFRSFQWLSLCQISFCWFLLWFGFVLGA